MGSPKQNLNNLNTSGSLHHKTFGGKNKMITTPNKGKSSGRKESKKKLGIDTDLVSLNSDGRRKKLVVGGGSLLELHDGITDALGDLRVNFFGDWF